MKNTTNFNLKKPDYNDIVDIADINSNMDIIDAELKKKVDTTVINELKVELANSKEIEKKVDKIVGGTAGTILLQKEDGGIKSSNVQIQELVKETKLTAEVGKLIPKVSNATNNKIAILNSDGTLKQGNKTIEEILNSTTWNNIQGKPNNLATTENIATAKNDLEDKINKKVEVAKSLSSKDLNTVYDVGFYSCSSCRNIPSGANGYASLIVMKGDSTITSNSTTDTVQIYIDANTKMYIRDCIDKNNSWDSWKEQVNTDLTGQLNGLRTNNKTNLVNAINEVFQLGTDRGNIIKNKVGALAGKTMQNMGDVADELEKYDVEMDLKHIFSFSKNYSSDKIDNYIFEDYLFSSVGRDLKDDYFGVLDLEKLTKLNQVKSININNPLIWYKNDNFHVVDIKNNFAESYSSYKLGLDTYEEVEFLKLNGKLFYTKLDYLQLKIREINGEREYVLSHSGVLRDSFGNKFLISSSENIYIYNNNFRLEKSFNIRQSEYESVFLLKDIFIVFNRTQINVFGLRDGTKFKNYNFTNCDLVLFEYNGLCSVKGQVNKEELYFIKKNENIDYDEIYKIDNSGNLSLHAKYVKLQTEIHQRVSHNGKYLLTETRDNYCKVYKLTKTLKKVR